MHISETREVLVDSYWCRDAEFVIIAKGINCIYPVVLAHGAANAPNLHETFNLGGRWAPKFPFLKAANQFTLRSLK